MRLENVVIDAMEPQLLGVFWEAALGGTRLTDEPDIFETRLTIDRAAFLDLCFQRVEETHPTTGPARLDPRLHLDLAGDPGQSEAVERVLRLDARRCDIGQGDVTWEVLADPEGNPFCVLEDGAANAVDAPLAALHLQSADPARDAAFWAWLTGWTEVEGLAPGSLRHPSGHGPLLELWPESAPKGAYKNKLHLDLRLEADDDPDVVAGGVAARGGREVHHPEWGELPWRFFEDPSGNEFCVLRSLV